MGKEFGDNYSLRAAYDLHSNGFKKDDVKVFARMYRVIEHPGIVLAALADRNFNGHVIEWHTGSMSRSEAAKRIFLEHLGNPTYKLPSPTIKKGHEMRRKPSTAKRGK